MSLQVVNLGLPKTGTTTLARALRAAGYRVADYRIRGWQKSNLTGAFVADLLYQGRFEHGDPGARLGPFTALTEISLLREGRSLWPQTDFGMIDAIRNAHPQVKFLASRRDPFELSQSMLAWSDLGTARLPQSAVPGLPPGFGATTKERMAWIASHDAFLDHVFQGADNFLAYDVTDPATPQRIGAFLGRPLPWWGRANHNPSHKVA